MPEMVLAPGKTAAGPRAPAWRGPAAPGPGSVRGAGDRDAIAKGFIADGSEPAVIDCDPFAIDFLGRASICAFC